MSRKKVHRMIPERRVGCQFPARRAYLRQSPELENRGLSFLRMGFVPGFLARISACIMAVALRETEEDHVSFL
jgi:hypothetical protein